MAENSKIQWTTHTFNPWIGCMKVSPGCKNCYASVNTFTRAQRSQGRELWGPASTTDRHVTSDAKWREPVKWNREAEAAGVRAFVFCASMADVFEDHPSLPPIRERLWPLIEATPWLDWQLLTKRPENVIGMVPEGWRAAFPPNVWIGTSVEDQQRADERVPALLRIPARVRFLSCEPLIGPVDLTRVSLGECAAEFHDMPHVKAARFTVDALRGAASLAWPALSWVIVGGESGNGARPMRLEWARDIVRQCRAAGVPVFVKQLGAIPIDSSSGRPVALSARSISGYDWRAATALRDRKGGDIDEWPADLQVREMPA